MKQAFRVLQCSGMRNTPITSTTGSDRRRPSELRRIGRISCRLILLGRRAWRLLEGEPTQLREQWLVFFAVLGLGFCTPYAAISDEDDPADVVAAPQFAIREPRFLFTQKHFDDVMFRYAGRSKESDRISMRSKGYVEHFKSKMEAAFANETERLKIDLELTEEQAKRILLASRGDVLRLIERIHSLRQKCTDSELTRTEYLPLLNEAHELSKLPSVITFSETTLFRKCLLTCLTPKQRELNQAVRRGHQIAAINEALDTVGRVSYPDKLDQDVRQRITEMLLTHGDIPGIQHPYAATVVMLEADVLKRHIQPLLSDSQWQIFRAQVGKARELELTLRTLGIWSPALRFAAGNEVRTMVGINDANK